MIWLTWRQHRWEALAAAALLLTIAAVSVIQGLRGAELAAQLDLHGCATRFDSACGSAFRRWSEELGWSGFLSILFVLLPAAVAPFLAAPLVSREYEFRTSLLVWTQGVTRTRWLAAKLALFATALGGAALVLAAVAPVAERAWSYNPVPWHSSIEWSLPVMLGTALLALGMGVFCGALTRRILAAMLLSLVLVGLVRGGVGQKVRPELIPPVVSAAGATIPADVWMVGSYYVDRQENVVPADRAIDLTRGFFTSEQRARYRGDLDRYLADQGIAQRFEYHPKEHAAALQALEFGIYAGLAVVLIAVTFWMVRRRPA